MRLSTDCLLSLLYWSASGLHIAKSPHHVVQELDEGEGLEDVIMGASDGDSVLSGLMSNEAHDESRSPPG